MTRALIGDELEILAQAVTASTVDSVFCKDTDYRYTYVNPHMEALLGRTSEGLLGRRPEDVFGPEDAAIVRSLDERCFAGEPVDETRVITVDGRAHTFHTVQTPVRDGQMRVIGECGFVRDVTALLDARQALMDSRDMLATAESVAHIGSWRWDMATGGITWSDEMKRICGIDPADFGDDAMAVIGACVHPEDRVVVERAMRRALTVAQALPIEYRVVHPDGRIRMIRAEGRVMRDAKDAPVALVGCAHDITDRFASERALDQARTKLVQAERFAAIGRVATGVSHELREPLSAISRLSETIEYAAAACGACAEVCREASQVVRAHADACLLFLEDFQGEVRRGAGDTVLVNLCRAVEGALAARAADPRLSERRCVRGDGNVTLEDLTAMRMDARAYAGASRGSDPEMFVRGTAGQLERVLAHLIGNALDATKPGDAIVVGCRRDGDGAVLCVADNGEGIAAERIRYIFEPFYSTRASSSEGIGLWSSRRIIEGMGGLIACQSEVGVGTIMRIWLPVARPESRREAVPAAPAGA